MAEFGKLADVSDTKSLNQARQRYNRAPGNCEEQKRWQRKQAMAGRDLPAEFRPTAQVTAQEAVLESPSGRQRQRFIQEIARQPSVRPRRNVGTVAQNSAASTESMTTIWHSVASFSGLAKKSGHCWPSWLRGPGRLHRRWRRRSTIGSSALLPRVNTSKDLLNSVTCRWQRFVNILKPHRQATSQRYSRVQRTIGTLNTSSGGSRLGRYMTRSTCH